MSDKQIKVSWFAANKSGFTEIEILERYKVANIGYDGTFTLLNQAFYVDRMCEVNIINWIGKVPISWYEEDLETERKQKQRKDELRLKSLKEFEYRLINTKERKTNDR